MSDAAIKEAMDAAKVFLSNTAGQRAYINRQMVIMDRQAQLENAHNDGFQEGQQEGENLLSELIQRLLADGRNADISLAVSDPKAREKLYKEYGIKR